MDNTPSVVFIVPGSLDICSGGYEYDRRILAGLRGLGWSVDVRELGGSFPFPSAETLVRVARVLADIPSGTLALVDGLALGVLPAQIEQEAERLRFVALVHHPLAEETGLDPQAAEILEQSERRALNAVVSVVVTSHATAVNLARFGVHADRIAVVEPGTDAAPLARGSGESAVHFLSVAAVIPRKGHEVLMEALGLIEERDWRLTCVGGLDRDPHTAARVRALAGGFGGCIVLAGEGDRPTVRAEFDRADVFVMPSLHEGYGMAVAEALACGLPVVGTDTGAISELLSGMSGADGHRVRGADGLLRLPAGLLVPPGDVDLLAEALSLIVRDRELRDRLTSGAREVRDRLPSWDETSNRMAKALTGAAARR
jgi:glycosyltransferase involved in cell wall biosynthesis